MPELPEVETVVRSLRPRLIGRRIVAFRSLWKANTQPSVPRVRRAILNRTILELRRRAKFIVVSFESGRAPAGDALLIHLRMSGRFEWAGESARSPHVRAWWRLDDGAQLLFCDARKFGRIVHVPDLDAALERRLGPEPLAPGFTRRRLAELLASRSRLLKPSLLDQRFVAGLGNIYVDEALFAARLHPRSRSDELTPPQASRLHAAIRRTLQKAIRHNGTTFDWIYPGGDMQNHLAVYGRGGEPCPRCGEPIQVLRVAQRGTHICPRCQPRR